jgi:hypothetical protein
MLAKLEELGDRLLSLVVPQAHAAAKATCCWNDGVCDRTRDWWCCYTPGGTAPGRCPAGAYCSAFNPHPC